LNTLFCGNFDFEFQLACSTSTPPESLRRRNDELASVWVTVAGECDALCMSARIDPRFWDSIESAGLPRLEVVRPDAVASTGVEFCAWGISSFLLDWARSVGVAVTGPSAESVRNANRRSFSIGLEREWGVGIPGAVVVHSVSDWQRALDALPDANSRWLLKAEFGMAGRERVSGHGRHPPEATVNWLRRGLRRDGCAVFEPWVDVVAEAGIQFEISSPEQGGTITLQGITPLFADEQGGYRGSRFDDDPAVHQKWSPAVDVGWKAAERLRSRGYFGPLGIDAALYRDAGGELHFRPLQDVNARFTMGRLSLGCRKLLQPGEQGVWLHQRWPTDAIDGPKKSLAEFVASLPTDCRAIPTSPFLVDDRPVGHGTVIVLGRDLIAD